MLVPKSDFVGLEGVVHLAAGGETPMLTRHAEAYARFAEDKAQGLPGRVRFEEARARVRQRLAGMLGMQPGDIALLGSSSEAIGQVISAIDWSPGDNVVVAEHEFPSGLFALARLRDLGVELRLIPTPEHTLDVDALIARCDARTRLAYVSHVSFRTGQRVDVARLADGIHAKGGALLLDATHALGVVPVPGELCDFVVCSGYKWLLATHQGILAWNRRLQPNLQPLGVGWRSADAAGDPAQIYALHSDATRAEVGNPNHLDVYILESALGYLADVGLDRITAHVLDLGERLRAGLCALGLTVTTPAAADQRAGNICFAHPRSERLAELALARGMQIWGGDGRVRLSVHLYTTAADVDAALAALPGLLAEAEG